MHNNMITINGQKMGKSLGNFINLDQFFTALICQNFNAFFEKHVSQYEQKEISFCGSIAYFFNSELKHIASNYGCKVALVIEKPIAALSLFYVD